MADPTRKELVSAAKDMNKVLGLEPPIDVKLKPAELTEQIKIEAVGTTEEPGVHEKDKLKEATWNVLSALEVNPREEKTTTSIPKKEEKAPKKEKAEKKAAPTAKKEKKAPAKKTEKKEKVKKLTLADCINLAVERGAVGKEQITKVATKIRAETAGGEYNPRPILQVLLYALPLLQAHGTKKAKETFFG